MATKTIDLAFHGSTFPATYIGPGNLIGNPVLNRTGDAVSGYFTGTGDAVNIPVGFAPTKIEVADETNNIVWQWYRGQAAGKVFKQVAAGTETVDTGSAITVAADLAGNAVITLSATLAASAANLIYRIDG